MRLTSCLLAAVFVGGVASGAVTNDGGRPLKVLMVGNSFSESVLVELPKVAAATSNRLVLAGGRGPGTNDTVKRYSRGGWVMIDPSVRRIRRPVACRLIAACG